ncbi:MAG: ACP S-malonyltransferase [Paludibacteraceae bacterium]|nr:ACP S-malonyltransferase [Paludibacteraceae bacterium]
MLKAFVFPGQGSQFPGMCKDLYDAHAEAREMCQTANRLLGFSLTDVMFDGSADDLKQTKVTQPAVFLHSVVAQRLMTIEQPDMVAGHSLGEFSALVACGALRFEDALLLVSARAQAMQAACEANPGTMAAVLGLPDEKVVEICEQISSNEAPSLEGRAGGGVVVAANFNCPGQIVISGDVDAVDAACVALKEAGARRALKLPVGGAFHSPLMQPAAEDLKEAILKTDFHKPFCPIYQNVTAKAETEPGIIRENLLKQLTAPVRWTQSVQNMIADANNGNYGNNENNGVAFYEFGPGDVLKGMIRKINPEVQLG